MECSVHEVWSSILDGVNQDFFFESILPIKILSVHQDVESTKNFFQDRMSVL